MVVIYTIQPHIKGYTMENNTTFKLAGKEITIKELNVKQIKDILSQVDKDEPQFLDDLINEPVPALIIQESSGIPVEEMEKMFPSELIELAGEVKKVNPLLASMIARRVEAFEKMGNLLKNQAVS